MRYGIEVEGPFKGRKTLILDRAAQHTPETLVATVLSTSTPLAVQHLWLEVQPHEMFDWDHVRALCDLSDLCVTVQASKPEDLPPIDLRARANVGLVWCVDKRFMSLLAAADFIKAAHAPGIGYETPVHVRPFVLDDYKDDVAW